MKICSICSKVITSIYYSTSTKYYSDKLKICKKCWDNHKNCYTVRKNRYIIFAGYGPKFTNIKFTKKFIVKKDAYCMNCFKHINRSIGVSKSIGNMNVDMCNDCISTIKSIDHFKEMVLDNAYINKNLNALRSILYKY